MLTKEMFLQTIDEWRRGGRGLKDAQEAGVPRDEMIRRHALEPDIVNFFNSFKDGEEETEKVRDWLMAASVAAALNGASLFQLIEVGYHLRKLEEKQEREMVGVGAATAGVVAELDELTS